MSGRFLEEKRQSLAFKAAVQALRDLARTDGWGHVHDAYSEAVFEANEAHLRQRYGEPKQQDLGAFLRLRGADRFSCALPGGDHVLRWKKKGEPGFGAYTSEPYGLSLQDMRATVAVCEEYKLDCHISTGSRHFPSACLLIVLRRKEDLALEDIARRVAPPTLAQGDLEREKLR
jgi:hypothetical protein